MKLTNQKSFTLMEVMVTAVIFSFVAAGVYTTFLVGTRSWSYYNDSVILKQEVRRTLFSMCQELREAENVFITSDEIRGVTLSFHRPAVGYVTYSWSNRGENAHQIIRQYKDQTKILARSVTSLSFTQKTTSDILIEIGSVKPQKNGKDMIFNLKQRVAFRGSTGLLKGSES